MVLRNGYEWGFRVLPFDFKNFFSIFDVDELKCHVFRNIYRSIIYFFIGSPHRLVRNPLLFIFHFLQSTFINYMKAAGPVIYFLFIHNQCLYNK